MFDRHSLGQLYLNCPPHLAVCVSAFLFQIVFACQCQCLHFRFAFCSFLHHGYIVSVVVCVSTLCLLLRRIPTQVQGHARQLSQKQLVDVFTILFNAFLMLIPKSFFATERRLKFNWLVNHVLQLYTRSSLVAAGFRRFLGKHIFEALVMSTLQHFGVRLPCSPSEVQGLSVGFLRLLG